MYARGEMSAQHRRKRAVNVRNPARRKRPRAQSRTTSNKRAVLKLSTDDQNDVTGMYAT
eukprot:CAMPEP_0113281190 /NCGR_PEP_ID=MMETSP0008_2-20120614/28159_1 /TAXON_ID=97485 /ORGANISM="Prymnesium parvum" /LENGTH=58 /DNA_ID=CAMNT_0000131571 /DNA_START=591 /DNA_END=763 /DNA_ORIENTATION=+ /assembly_acc=CAM_ASM_000153